MERILITGGAGFIGSNLIDKLLAENYEVYCLDNFNDLYPPKFKRNNIIEHLKHKNYQLIEEDITNFEVMAKIFKKYRFDKVVHLAAMAGVRESIQMPLYYEQINVIGTINLLECVKKYPVKNFIFGSSSSVYGINSKVPFSEDDKIEFPISPYAASKRSGELNCFTYHHLFGIPISCFRFFTVYGPRQRPKMAIHKFTRLIDTGQEITLYGDGTSQRDYTYVTDIISGLYAAINKPFDFEIFNLGESTVVELKYLVSLIEKNLGKSAKIKWLPMQPGDVPITYSDVTKAQKLLGYSPSVTIEEGIEKFVNWYTQNKDNLY